MSVLFCGPAFGQSIGANIAGIVTDQTGALLQDTAVTITHIENGRSLPLKTGKRGEYRAVALLPGEYTLVAEHEGFAPAARQVTLLVGADATVNFTLPLAGVVEQTTVNTATPLLEVARSQPSSVVTEQDIDTLPVLERNSWCWRSSCRDPVRSTARSPGWHRPNSVASPISAAGYTTLVDGGDDQRHASGAVRRSMSAQEAVQEFKVFRHQFDAQYGHALNAVVTVVTRSGTNRFQRYGLLLRPR